MPKKKTQAKKAAPKKAPAKKAPAQKKKKRKPHPMAVKAMSIMQEQGVSLAEAWRIAKKGGPSAAAAPTKKARNAVKRSVAEKAIGTRFFAYKQFGRWTVQDARDGSTVMQAANEQEARTQANKANRAAFKAPRKAKKKARRAAKRSTFGLPSI